MSRPPTALIVATVYWSGALTVAMLVGAAVLEWTPTEAYPSAWICPEGEVLVQEIEVVTGSHPTETTRMCCADPADPRTYGRCDWSNSQPLDEAFQSVAACSLSMGLSSLATLCAFVPPFLLALLVWGLRRGRGASPD